MSSYANLFLLKKDLVAPLQAIAFEFPKPEATLSENDSLTISRDSVQKMRIAAERFWQFLWEHGESPYNYGLSGQVMDQALFHLKRHGIDLVSSKLATGNGDFEWFLLDAKVKEKYIKHLLPSNFTEKALSGWFEVEQGSVTMEELFYAIKIIHAYLELVDNSNLVLLNIG